jgi:hypothetical protein
MSDEKMVATKAEVQRLLDAGFICEVLYPSWLANVVMATKRMVNNECAQISPTSTSVIRKTISRCRG